MNTNKTKETNKETSSNPKAETSSNPQPKEKRKPPKVYNKLTAQELHNAVSDAELENLLVFFIKTLY